MSDKMGGSSNVKVPAWKLRQQQRQRQNGLSVSLNVANDELGRPRRPRVDDELGGKTNDSGKTPAWKIREQYKTRGGNNFDDGSIASGSSRSTYSRASASSTPSSKTRTVSMVPEDPNLPPAFRTMNRLQQRKRVDDFNSLCSVHSRSVTGSRAGGSRVDTRSAAHSYANSYGSNESFEFLDSDSDDDSFDGEDSFASLESDADEDDEAYRESRNQMARLKIEKQQQSQDPKRVGKSRFKKKTTGVHGTPLDFIAE